ncbi:MAG: 2,3-bisphosphoglycerate-dependent phosphoglycerate mutase, partial [Phenylobacterium sp.]|nr:2,3-bisphosphoglycerate-dependent phosphoglycerate mutase [Phenylobacterium sp.]
KTETAAKHGAEQVRIWRRSYDTPPPPLAPGGEWDFSRDRRYAGVVLPDTESLKTTLERVEPYWTQEIVPKLAAGETVLVAAHGNSLRAIVKLLYGLSAEGIMEVEIPTSNPLVIDLDAGLKPLTARYLDADRAQPVPKAP